MFVVMLNRCAKGAWKLWTCNDSVTARVRKDRQKERDTTEQKKETESELEPQIE